ncbi:MAG: nucleotide exchange factor GrpE [Planctomycetes bacterium]|nr:nucleotide exchange factor GrpE [Planctomycetota bacterium]MBL7038123.1 nucleotide exchange factor GrpE [Pirellulaceae bacterium]
MSEAKEQVPNSADRAEVEELVDTVMAGNDQQADAETDEPVDPQTEVEKLQADLAAANDRALRAQAELDNFRKRSFRQMDEERKYACVLLLRDLLSVTDNLDRAIEAAEQNENSSSLLEGVKMVGQQLTGVLEQHHCRPINAKGEVFDPHLHEAIAQQPSAEHPAGSVIEVTQVGYQLHDRVVRPSQVLVSSGMPEAQPEANTNGESEKEGE